jgi:hypothetical protein
LGRPCCSEYNASNSIFIYLNLRNKQVKSTEDEIIEASLAVIHQLSIQPDSTDDDQNDIDILKAVVLNSIGLVLLRREDLTEDEAKKGLRYLDDSRKIFEAIRYVHMTSATEAGVFRPDFMRDVMSGLEADIANFKAKCIEKFGAQEAFGKPVTREEVLEKILTAFQPRPVSSSRQNAARGLIKSHRIIEAWRLLKRLVAIS